MESLRERQRREVLDEDKVINQRVFDREKEAVKVMGESVLPKKTRDIESETSVDKLIESIQRVLEGKMVSIEFLMTYLAEKGKAFKGDSLRAYNNLIINTDFVSLWNQLVRVYTTAGLSRNSQEAIKVKFQDLKTNIDAMDYGLEELFQLYIESEFFEVDNYKQAYRLLQSQAIYRNVKNQLFQGQNYRQIDAPEISISVKEIISELSEEQRQKLKMIEESPIEDRSLLKLPIEIGQNADRIRALESEMGFVLPDDVKENISGLTKRQEEQAFNEIRGSQGLLPEEVEGATVESLRQDYDDMKDNLDQQKLEIGKNIPELKHTLIELQKDLLKQRRYIQQYPEEMDEKGQYSRELRAEEDKYNQMLEYVQRVRQLLNENLQRQRSLKRDYEEIRKWYDNAQVELQEKKVQQQKQMTKVIRYGKAASIRKPNRFLLRDARRGRGNVVQDDDDNQCYYKVGRGNVAQEDDDGEAYYQTGRGKPVYLGRASFPLQLGQKRGTKPPANPYNLNRIRRSYNDRDYGHDDDNDNDLYNFSRGGSKFEFNDERNDLYKIQGMK
jgi:hypothetical protein